MATKKAIAQKATQELATAPDYIKTGGNRGSENVSNEDLQLPRIAVCQALSPQKSKKKPEYIEGIAEGMLFNTLTGELYPDGITFTPVTFQKRWFVWQTQDTGGGLNGIFDFDQQAEAEAATKKLNDDSSDDQEFECVLTHEHLVLFPDGTEIILSMAKSKLKVSKKFNSLVRLNGGDRFSRNYTLNSIEDENKNGKEYWNFKVANQLGKSWPTQELYEAAEALHANITGGTTFGGDYTDETTADDVVDSDSGY